MIKKSYLKDCNKWLVSGFNDKSQDKNLVKVGFDKRVLKVFDSEAEADQFLKELEGE